MTMAIRIPVEQPESPMTTEPHIRFAGVSKSYDGTIRVVKDLDLDIVPGEFLTLLGPSGSGKTTTLMMLAGFETVTEGNIFVAGSPIQHLPPHKRDIGIVFQNYALFPHMSVGDNVGFPLEVRSVAKEERRRRVDAALEMVRLSGYADRKPAQLSGGQQQRVALARALVFEPRLVLLDEPLGALDRQLREQMQYELKRLHGELGITMVYVTHDQQEALTMSDRIAVFNHGVIQQLGPPRDLYNRPRNLFVARFIGENNFLPVSVVTSDGVFCDVSGRSSARLRALAGETLTTGQKAMLAIRPERARIGMSAETVDNRLCMRVTDTTFLGDQLRIAFETEAGEPFIAKVPLGHDVVAPKPGETMTVGFAAQDGLVLADDGAGTAS